MYSINDAGSLIKCMPPTYYPFQWTLTMLKLLSSKTQGHKDFWKQSKACHVGIHWIALAEYSPVSTHMPWFQSFFKFFLHHFVLAKLADTRIREQCLYLLVILKRKYAVGERGNSRYLCHEMLHTQGTVTHLSWLVFEKSAIDIGHQFRRQNSKHVCPCPDLLAYIWRDCMGLHPAGQGMTFNLPHCMHASRPSCPN